MGQICTFIAYGLATPCGDLLASLNQHTGLCVVSASGGEQTLALMGKIRPDVLLLDECLIDAQQSLLMALHRSSPVTRIVLFNSRVVDGAFIVRTLSLGVRGVMLKDCELHAYAKAVLVVSVGGLWLGRQALELILLQWACAESEPGIKPTPRESEIIDCVCRGMTNKEAARHLGISDKTVKVHLNHIYNKLGISRRMHLALLDLQRPVASQAAKLDIASGRGAAQTPAPRRGFSTRSGQPEAG